MNPEWEKLPEDLQYRLKMIIQEVPHFWEQGPYTHYTNHGPTHSERIHRQKLGQLAQELPEHNRLTEDEIFIVSAAAWLYEIGMQCPYDYRPGAHVSFAQLEDIRAQKHELTFKMIFDSVRREYKGPTLQLGLMRLDPYTQLIAEVCRYCSTEPLDEVPEELPVNGVMVRVRLLVALLRLADQLYIDQSRVNLDMLQAANLPMRDLARWWAYHYTQVLPIERGRIRFFYYLPEQHKQYLPHIRTLIEPEFKYDRNPIIRYLWDKYDLKLVPQPDPGIRTDRQGAFLREMSREMIAYLRQSVPIPPSEPSWSNTKSVELPPTEDRCLMVLDYENFLLQLGREGYFFTADEIARLAVTLLKEASAQYNVPIDGLAVGQWDRPDLDEIATILRSRVYTLLSVSAQETSAERLANELTQRLQEPSTYRNVLLVAPHEDLALLVRRFTERRQSISAWISNLPDAEIFQAVVRNFQFLPHVLALSSQSVLEIDRLVGIQMICILRLDTYQETDHRGATATEIATALKQVESARESAEWWRLWLINQHILIVVERNGHSLFELNSEHPQVQKVRERRSAVVRGMLALMKDHRSVAESVLINDLERQIFFRDGPKAIREFLELLKLDDLLQVDQLPNSLDSEPLWYLNFSHWAVITSNADRYLPLLILAIDHFMVKEGYFAIHEHNVIRRIAPYVGDSVAETLYHLALNREIAQRRVSNKKHRFNDEYLVDVRLVDEHDEVRTTIRNRAILLDLLYQRGQTSGLERQALLSTLNSMRAFTLTSDQINQWLIAFQRDSIILVQPHPHDTSRDSIRLNLDSLLTQRLLGQLIVYSLIQVLRIMGAVNPERTRPTSDILERLARHVRRGNRQLSQWALDYARSVNLVELVRRNEAEGSIELVYLRRSGLVYNLDQRESYVCQAICELVEGLSRYYPDRRVPLPVVIREMEKNHRMGLTSNEHDYWIDQAVYRRKMLEKKTEYPHDRPPQNFLIMRPKERQ